MLSEISNDNLFITGYMIDFPKDGESLLLRDKLVITGDEQDDYYVYRDNDRLDLIAYKYYGNSKLWWVIADANNIYNPFEMGIYVGKELLVPSIEKVKLAI